MGGLLRGDAPPQHGAVDLSLRAAHDGPRSPVFRRSGMLGKGGSPGTPRSHTRFEQAKYSRLFARGGHPKLTHFAVQVRAMQSESLRRFGHIAATVFDRLVDMGDLIDAGRIGE